MRIFKQHVPDMTALIKPLHFCKFGCVHARELAAFVNFSHWPKVGLIPQISA